MLTDPIVESLIETSTVKLVYPIIVDIDSPITTSTAATTTVKIIEPEIMKTFEDVI